MDPELACLAYRLGLSLAQARHQCEEAYTEYDNEADCYLAPRVPDRVDEAFGRIVYAAARLASIAPSAVAFGAAAGQQLASANAAWPGETRRQAIERLERLEHEDHFVYRTGAYRAVCQSALAPEHWGEYVRAADTLEADLPEPARALFRLGRAVGRVLWPTYDDFDGTIEMYRTTQPGYVRADLACAAHVCLAVTRPCFPALAHVADVGQGSRNALQEVFALDRQVQRALGLLPPEPPAFVLERTGSIPGQSATGPQDPMGTGSALRQPDLTDGTNRPPAENQNAEPNQPKEEDEHLREASLIVLRMLYGSVPDQLAVRVAKIAANADLTFNDRLMEIDQSFRQLRDMTASKIAGLLRCTAGAVKGSHWWKMYSNRRTRKEGDGPTD